MMFASLTAVLLTAAAVAEAQSAPGLPAYPVPLVVPPPPPAPVVLYGVVAPPRRLRANLEYFSEDDYPASALRQHHEGTTVFALEIGADGRVSNCTVTRSSGSPPLDAATCRILRSRARYIPARLADGSPARGSDHGRVNWRLPEEEGRAGIPMAAVPARPLAPEASQVTAADLPYGAPPAAPAFSSELRVAIGVQGRAIGCDVAESSGAPALDEAACRRFAARARFEPARNLAGAPVCDVVWIRVDWSTAFAGPAPTPRPREPLPGPLLPLRRQLNAGLCPGWSPGPIGAGLPAD